MPTLNLGDNFWAFLEALQVFSPGSIYDFFLMTSRANIDARLCYRETQHVSPCHIDNYILDMRDDDQQASNMELQIAVASDQVCLHTETSSETS